MRTRKSKRKLSKPSSTSKKRRKGEVQAESSDSKSPSSVEEARAEEPTSLPPDIEVFADGMNALMNVVKEAYEKHDDDDIEEEESSEGWVPSDNEESDSSDEDASLEEDVVSDDSIQPAEPEDDVVDWDEMEKQAEEEDKKRGYKVDKPKKKKSKKATSAAKTEGNSDLVKVESAKTGRSTCRRCKVKIKKAETRIGLEAWIMGRQSVTWQHPKCFTKGIHFSPSPSSRGSCKYSGESFEKDEVRFGMTSHTSKTYIKLENARVALEAFLSTCGAVDLSKTDGYKHLDSAQRKLLEDGVGKNSAAKAESDTKA